MNDARVLERAFELARSGTVTSVDDIRRKLKEERFEGVDQHVAGGTLTTQLRAIMAALR